MARKLAGQARRATASSYDEPERLEERSAAAGKESEVQAGLLRKAGHCRPEME